jgi:hypothetical protein
MSTRYAGMKPTSVTYRGQMIQSLPLRKTPSQAFRFTYHQVSSGQRMDLLAGRYVGDSQEWHIIADVNPEKLYFGDLQPSEIIRIPYV